MSWIRGYQISVLPVGLLTYSRAALRRRRIAFPLDQTAKVERLRRRSGSVESQAFRKRAIEKEGRRFTWNGGPQGERGASELEVDR